MKTLLLSMTILIFALILIVIFQNIATSFNGVWVLFFKFDQKMSGSIGVLAFVFLGFIAGALSTSLAAAIAASQNEEEPGGF